MSVFADVKDWMRVRQCFAILLAGAYGEDSKWPTENQRIAAPDCYGYCEVIADRVDVYYCLDQEQIHPVGTFLGMRSNNKYPALEILHRVHLFRLLPIEVSRNLFINSLPSLLS